MEFPRFDGSNPRLWKDKCELYFEVYGVSEALKPRFAALNFEKTAEAWLQTTELRGRFTTWEALHTAVCQRFDKDQYQLHMKQLDNLKQTASVAEYHAQFEQLTHDIMLYNSNYDDTFLVTHFLGGLRNEICAPLALHRPKNVDTASALALLQEEELESQKKQHLLKNENKDSSKSGSWGFSASEKSRAPYKKEEVKKGDKSVGDSKWASLLAHRKANGLFYTCGEKWTGKGHKCPDQVPIHMLQELMEMFHLDIPSDAASSDSDEDQDEVCVVAVEGEPVEVKKQKKKRNTMRFIGFVGKQEISILLDSGSAGTFISQDLASRLQPQLQDCETLNFRTADGKPLTSDKFIPKSTISLISIYQKLAS
ncbi:unnamed protein product [Urochloa humidicola]